MNTMTGKWAAMLGMALLAGGLAGSGIAQDSAGSFPAKPVTIILATSGPGSVDTEYRLYAQAMREQNGPQFVLDYRGGGGGAIGMAYVAKAAPDGYTLLGAVSSFITIPFVNDNAGFDNVKDFAPVSLLSKRFFMLLVHPSAPFRNVRDYLAYARSHPGELNWSTAGMGSSTHMPGELLHSMSNTKVTFVHYKAPSQRLIDLIAGRVHVTGGSALASLGYVKGGKLRAIGVTGLVRSKLMPDVPTIAEQGVPGYEFSSWLGLLAPAKVSPQVVGRINALFKEASRNSSLVKKLDEEDTLMVNSTPQEFRDFIVAENRRWGKVIKDAGITVEE